MIAHSLARGETTSASNEIPGMPGQPPVDGLGRTKAQKLWGAFAVVQQLLILAASIVLIGEILTHKSKPLAAGIAFVSWDTWSWMYFVQTERLEAYRTAPFRAGVAVPRVAWTAWRWVITFLMVAAFVAVGCSLVVR